MFYHKSPQRYEIYVLYTDKKDAQQGIFFVYSTTNSTFSITELDGALKTSFTFVCLSE